MTAGIRRFGTLPDGRPVQIIRLNHAELSVRVLTLGAILQDVRLAGAPHSLTLGSDQLGAYAGPMQYFGAVVGPVANRINHAAAPVSGKLHHFDANEAGRTTLHGGTTGTHSQIWDVVHASASALTLRLLLPDGLGGFPGNRTLTADFALSGNATLTLTLAATTDAATLINLTNHSFWTLGGRATTAGHSLRVAADSYLGVDENRIPSGAPIPVTGTRYDLRQSRLLDQTENYDHNWCLAPAQRPLTPVAELTGQNGLRLTIGTTEPGLQIYDAARLDTAPYLGHMGQPYGAHAGIALETQGWPDAPNRPDFPCTVLAPGQPHRQQTRFSFSRA